MKHSSGNALIYRHLHLHEQKSKNRFRNDTAHIIFFEDVLKTCLSRFASSSRYYKQVWKCTWHLKPRLEGGLRCGRCSRVKTLRVCLDLSKRLDLTGWDAQLSSELSTWSTYCDMMQILRLIISSCVLDLSDAISEMTMNEVAWNNQSEFSRNRKSAEVLKEMRKECGNLDFNAFIRLWFWNWRWSMLA